MLLRETSVVADSFVEVGPAPAEPRARGWWRREVARTRTEHPGLARVGGVVWEHPALVLGAVAFVSAAGITAAIHPGDTTLFVSAGTSMLGPGFLDVFADPLLQIGPVFLLVVGAVARLAGMLGLAPDPSVAAVLAAAVAWLTVTVTGGFARDAQRDVRTVQWVVGSTVVVGGLLADGMAIGHPEEIALGLLLAAAVRAAAQGRGAVTGALVGLATGVKLWGLLGAGAALHGRRWRTLLAAAGVGAVLVVLQYGPFFLWGDVGTFSFTWVQTDRSSLLPVLAAHLGLSDWGMRLIQGAAATLAGCLVAMRRDVSGLVVVVTVISVRLLLDPLRFPYYVGPLVVVVLIWAWTAPSRPGPAVRTALLGIAPVVVVVPYLVNGPAVTWTWTVVFAVLPAVLLRRERHRRRDVVAGPVSVSPTLA